MDANFGNAISGESAQTAMYGTDKCAEVTMHDNETCAETAVQGDVAESPPTTDTVDKGKLLLQPPCRGAFKKATRKIRGTYEKKRKINLQEQKKVYYC